MPPQSDNGASETDSEQPLRLGIFGAGGSGREIAWLARQRWGSTLDVTFLVDQGFPSDQQVNGIPLADLSMYAARFPGAGVIVAIGDPLLREQCVDKCRTAGLSFVTLIHPRCEISSWVTCGTGAVICAGSILTTNVSLGEHVHVNINCTVSHDVELGAFTTLSPGVHIAGWVTVGRSVFFGTGAVVKNGNRQRTIHIHDHAVIGAGACVIDDVPNGATVVGVPARRISRPGAPSA